MWGLGSLEGEQLGVVVVFCLLVVLMFGLLVYGLRMRISQTDREGDGRCGLNSECPSKALPTGITMSGI